MSRDWFVTGASSGFGRAPAEVVLVLGDRVVLAARRTGPVAEIDERHPESSSTCAPTSFVGQQQPDHLPLVVAQFVTAHPTLPIRRPNHRAFKSRTLLMSSLPS